MKIYIGTDHAGFELKQTLIPYIEELGFNVEDKGAYEYDEMDDYPDFIAPVAEAVSKNQKTKGIILGGSGQGEAIVANRFPGVRAVVYYGSPSVKLAQGGGSFEIVKLSRKHNDANILSLGARFLNEEQAKEAVKLWLETPFNGEERHKRRIKKIDNLKDEFDSWNNIKKCIDSEELTRFFRERDVFFIKCGKNIGFEQNGKGGSFERPVLILKKFNKNIFVGIPLSTTTKTGKYYIKIGTVKGRDNSAIISQIRLFDAKRLINKVGVVKTGVIEEIKKNIKEYIL